MLYSIEFVLDFKFNSAHFICHKHQREELHGHNYKLTVEVEGMNLNKENELIKEKEFHLVITSICNSLKHRLLIGKNNINLVISELNTNQISIKTLCDDKEFILPKEDIKVIEIDQISAEQLAKYISDQILLQKEKFQYSEVNYTKLVVKVYEDERKSASYTKY